MTDFLRCMELTETAIGSGYESQLSRNTRYVGTLTETTSTQNRTYSHRYNALVFKEYVNASGTRVMSPGPGVKTRISVFSQDFARSMTYDSQAGGDCQQNNPQHVVDFPSQCSYTSTQLDSAQACGRGDGQSRLAFSFSDNPPEAICQVGRTFNPVTTHHQASERMDRFYQGEKLKTAALRAINDRLTYLMSTMGSPGLSYNPSQIRMALFSDQSGEGVCHRAFAGERFSLKFQGDQVLCAMNPNDSSFCPPRSLIELRNFRAQNPNRNPDQVIQYHAERISSPIPGLLHPTPLPAAEVVEPQNVSF